MNLSKEQRLILINQYEILKHLNPNDTEYYDEYIATLKIGATYKYSMFEEIVEDEKSEEFQEFVWSVLDMFSYMKSAYRNLSDEYKQKISLEKILYQGFDGNEEGSYYSYANYIFKDMGLYTDIYKECKNCLNAHRNMVWRYSNMLKKLNECNDKYNLNIDDLLRIVD